jgi:hypothetical protein
MQPVQRPSYRLAIRKEQIEVVKTKLVFRIEHPGHDSVDGERRNGCAPLLLSRAKNDIQSGFVIHGADQNTYNILLS